MANIAARRVQPFQALLRLLLATGDVDEDSRAPAVGRHMHFVHGHQSDARIVEFALDQRGDLFAQGFLRRSR